MLVSLSLQDFEEITAWWETEQKLYPMTSPMLRNRLFPPEQQDPELLLGLRDAEGRLKGLAAGVFPTRWGKNTGGFRWLGLSQAGLREGRLVSVLEEMEQRLTARGAQKIFLMGTPPYYIRPGIDIRDTELIAALLQLGWSHEETYFNMSLDLTEWKSPTKSQVFEENISSDCRLRRAVEEDRQALSRLVEQHWSPGWRRESALGFDNDPISVFVAEREGELVGFAAYEVSQCLGSFGPTGVIAGEQGQGWGKRLLWACLLDLKQLGRTRCEIGWVGPVPFYYRACGATIGPVFWMLTRELCPRGN